MENTIISDIDHVPNINLIADVTNTLKANNGLRKYVNKYLNDELSDIHLIPPFPIDVIYTFAGEQSTTGLRLRYNGELRYSIRSIYKYAPWVNSIYIFISDETLYPSWLISEETVKNRRNVKIPIHISRHSEVYKNINNAVDNHNSDSIESRIHHIHGLANHFIYFNDDFFLGSPTSYLFFFNQNGIPRFPEFTQYWNYYNNLARNPILSHPIISKENQKIWQINYKVPYRTTNDFAEHMPRPYTRISWYELEYHYPKWFEFVESHKKRFCQCCPNKSGCLEEIIYMLMMTYRVLYYNINNNITFHNEVKQYDPYLYKVLYKNEAFAMELYKHPYSSANNLHRWLLGSEGFNVGNLRKFTESIKKYHSHTFCMNDVLDTDVKSRLYRAEIRFLHRFYKSNYNFTDDNALSFEKKNFTEPTIEPYVKNLDEIKYNDYGWPLESEYKIFFSHIPMNDGESIENFGFKHHILWGSYFETPEFICKTDLFSTSKNEICCHTNLFPAAYMYNQWNLDVNDIFCVIRHPYERIVEQYKFRLATDSYLAEEQSLMKQDYHETDKNLNDLNNYWCNIETMNKWIIASLKMYSSHRSIRDCHFLPQNEYIFDKTKKKKLCKNILRMDQKKPSFDQQFTELMAKYNITTTQSLKNYHSKRNQKCVNIAKVNNIYKETKQYIQQIYKEDFEYFNFD